MIPIRKKLICSHDTNDKQRFYGINCKNADIEKNENEHAWIHLYECHEHLYNKEVKVDVLKSLSEKTVI